MAIDKNELDQFYEYAESEDASTLEEALLRWRLERGSAPDRNVEFPAGRTLRERMAAAGTLGSCRSLPVDLSTNPDYMNGFGLSESAQP
jgi:hypothetical protein